MNTKAPNEDELAEAPLIENWDLRRAVLSKNRRQLHGVFHGHPEIVDGERGHSSDVIQIDTDEPPRWAICTSRVYRLGTRK
ncbi:hypothetical protein ACCS54_18730 [Rhizobium johnstonii]|uniref:hypothetical protein n=1 Tax=Rhizobium johnstonii TaxID=3019933 RepID=UPI003F9A708C